MQRATPRNAITVKPKSKEWDSTFHLLSWWKTEIVKSASVMVVGAGALGNEVLKNLTLMNVGNILIVDFDHIEYANLSRSVLFREKDCEIKSQKSDIAAERIREINPNVKVQTINGDITIDVGLGVFRRMDVVIGCLDNRLARLMLNRACYKVNKAWVDGAIENLTGIVNVYRPNLSCYECNLSKNDWFNIRYRLGCPDVARRNYSQGRIPTTPITSSIVGAIQTQEALKVINGNDKHIMEGELYYEGMNNLVLQLAPKPPKEICFSHFAYDPIETSPLSASNTIAETLAWLSDHLRDENPVILLDNELALQITTKESEITMPLVKPSLYLTEKYLEQNHSVKGEDVLITKETKEIDKHFEFLEKTLHEIGIPPLHIIRVIANEDIHFIELTADEGFLSFS
ncbi:MAG: ThiF family adenylyltransferase [Saprospiraceae bacterium]|nr:ThiF family adenylyltransferase [Saprospiraceae bacterium]